MNINASAGLNLAVSSALAGWLALTPDERNTLARAVATLNALDAPSGEPGAMAPAERVAFLDGRPLAIDAIPAFDPDLFRSATYRALGEGATLSLYCAGCRGLFELAQQVGFGSYKLGWTRGQGAETRIAHLRATAYAACRQDRGQMIADDGYDNWEPTVLPLQATRPVGSPVRDNGRSLLITLPEGIDPVSFDRDLMAALAPRSLMGFATSENGQAHCADLDLDPATLQRFTAPSTPQRRKHKAATELFRFAPRHEADLLARLVEAVVARAVMTLPQR